MASTRVKKKEEMEFNPVRDHAPISQRGRGRPSKIKEPRNKLSVLPKAPENMDYSSEDDPDKLVQLAGKIPQHLRWAFNDYCFDQRMQQKDAFLQMITEFLESKKFKRRDPNERNKYHRLS
ncbi:hypothetical protein SAMN05421823_1199 [Catalinimonas alkaloidigena]|uniref:Uncharacterized protein n=1 Tax=Catalinimonas alkaloidigena TaxID=1075417 RepID=A0A1G9V3T9_9BACT|nr:hypothetical protein [Catalinimonas alkaloidigena]SDM66862.1 hypothetical protein SAMN05421823_1199 [Catalinimonas alkaloidigena]